MRGTGHFNRPQILERGTKAFGTSVTHTHLVKGIREPNRESAPSVKTKHAGTSPMQPHQAIEKVGKVLFKRNRHLESRHIKIDTHTHTNTHTLCGKQTHTHTHTQAQAQAQAQVQAQAQGTGPGHRPRAQAHAHAEVQGQASSPLHLTPATPERQN